MKNDINMETMNVSCPICNIPLGVELMYKSGKIYPQPCICCHKVYVNIDEYNFLVQENFNRYKNRISQKQSTFK